jgi:hypothetical protein
LRGRAAGAVTTACGATQLRLRLRGTATAALRREGRIKLKVRATFTPTGGSANTEVRTIALGR